MPAFRRYTALVAIAAVATVVLVAPLGWEIGDQKLTFVLLAAATLLGELLPVSVPRTRSSEEVTMSSVFALAILFVLGPVAAIAVYVSVSLVSDLAARLPPAKVVFNAAHYAVSIGAAAGVLALAGALPPVPIGDNLPAIMSAIVAFFVVDNVVPAVGTAVLNSEPLSAALKGDAQFHLWTTGSPVALAPVVAAAAATSAWLVPLVLLTVVAFWVGGRQATAYAHTSLHDELTGLPNRSLVLLELGDRLRRSGRATVAVVDIVDFTAVNDAFGHTHGDAVLHSFAARLRRAFGDGDMVARLAGDEFAVVSEAPADEVAESICAALAEPFAIAELSLELRAQTGVAAAPGDATEAHALLTRASAALQRAKDRHLAWDRHDAELEDASLDRLMLAGHLRRAIERGELELHYQPKLATRPGGIHGVEALVRWRHPDLGMVQPDGFVPLAERVGLIDALTGFVLERAVEQCAAWRDSGLELRVAVNLSSHNLLDRELPAKVAGVLSRNLVPPRLLQVELTESTMVDLPLARQALEELRAIGVRVAIDDFGTGHSSLTQLRKLPLDEVKIDKSFVLGMEHDPDDAAIVKSTLALGRNLGLEVTAEGVETAAVCATLARLGCDYLQGYHLGRPLPAAEAREAVARCLAGGSVVGERLFRRVPDAPAEVAS